MRKLNYNFLEKSYESFGFFMPKIFCNNNLWVSLKYNNLALLDSFIYFNSFKRFLLYLRKLSFIQKNNNKKFLFIFDDDISCFFAKSKLNKTHFFANSIKEGINFTRSSFFANQISTIIYIGSLNKFSLEILSQLNYPVLMLTDKKQPISDYTQYSSLDFHSSVLFIKLLLEEVLSEDIQHKN